MIIDTKRLRAIANAATLGPRFLDENDGSLWAAGPTGDEVGDREIGDFDFRSNDIEFTLGCPPDVVLALLDEVEGLRVQLASAEAANVATTATLVEHSELSGHIDIAEQCRDYLLHLSRYYNSDKLQDFVESLRIVIDQLDRQRRSRNWYEVAYTTGKQKLIEHALSKVCCQGEPHTCEQEAIAAADGRTDRLILELAAMTAARDEACVLADRLASRDPMDMACVVCGRNMMAHPPECRLAIKLAELRKVGSHD